MSRDRRRAPRRAILLGLGALLAPLLLVAPASAAPLPEGVERIGIEVQGLPRQALVEAPEAPEAPAPILPGAKPPRPDPLPTLILLHDRGQSALQVRALADLARAEPFRGWLRVYPEGGARTWNAGRRRVDGGEAVRTPDVAFLRALVAKLAEDGLADPSRIILAGFGEGGAMVLRTLCEAPGLVQGAAIVGATWPASLNCSLGRPTSVLVFNGTEDPVAPWTGGQARGEHKIGAGALASVDRTISSLVAMNDCRAPLDETLPHGAGRKRIWFACEAPLMQWKIDGMGHRWPGAPDQGREGDGLGPPTPEGAPDATVMIAAFFVSLVERPGP
ncbi:hypothetical protein P2H44_18595 [Albimonas sp. CAU 1670]|uniref:alpha/beta hydrolase family esterase n=1 Tax=Albimonas sp. CAU 1670 TaxID=3032599 RepID=UPI0023DAEB82|nr:hypothetical protein [Albimonas sp. CAU 1670]MDF2234574.1 hypothetical protein [Albimonas sp. CAU 1670]